MSLDDEGSYLDDDEVTAKYRPVPSYHGFPHLQWFDVDVARGRMWAYLPCGHVLWLDAPSDFGLRRVVLGNPGSTTSSGLDIGVVHDGPSVLVQAEAKASLFANELLLSLGDL